MYCILNSFQDRLHEGGHALGGRRVVPVIVAHDVRDPCEGPRGEVFVPLALPHKSLHGGEEPLVHALQEVHAHVQGHRVALAGLLGVRVEGDRLEDAREVPSNPRDHPVEVATGEVGPVAQVVQSAPATLRLGPRQAEGLGHHPAALAAHRENLHAVPGALPVAYPTPADLEDLEGEVRVHWRRLSDKAREVPLLDSVHEPVPPGPDPEEHHAAVRVPGEHQPAAPAPVDAHSAVALQRHVLLAVDCDQEPRDLPRETVVL
mmetsp:Transcript_10553/g.36459  ORF Transcript_10553/g.36459 Transcript_10553/m.36459 type:complete len:261 (-) Transcript_10553:1084-1866(-)